jgi:hypothetical protein
MSVTNVGDIQSPQTKKGNSTMSILHSQITRYAARAAAVAGALALSTAGASAVSASQPAVHPLGFAPTQQCLSWSGTIQSFPGLTKVSQSVTSVIQGTLSNCNFDGTGQTFSGSFFGTLSGTATNSAASLSGHVAVSWPQDSGLNPTIASITVSGSAKAYSLHGTISNGAGTGEQLQGSYDVVSKQAINGGTSQSLLGSAPFEIEVNEG